MKRLVFIFSIILLKSCSIGFDNELDLEYAQRLINHHQSTGVIDSTLLKKSNAYYVVPQYDKYLFVLNEFSNDFNGWTWMQDTTANLIDLKLERFVIKQTVKKQGHWTKVIGK